MNGLKDEVRSNRSNPAITRLPVMNEIATPMTIAPQVRVRAGAITGAFCERLQTGPCYRRDCGGEREAGGGLSCHVAEHPRADCHISSGDNGEDRYHLSQPDHHTAPGAGRRQLSSPAGNHLRRR